jgi:sugar (pentulose or hexulose) kinase
MNKNGRYLLGTDIGTTLTKTVVVDLEGREIAAASSEYGVLHPHPLWTEQWPDVWYDAFVATAREVLARAGVRPDEIGGVGISGLYGGSGIPVDEKMHPIRPCIIWMDRRAVKEVDWIRSHVDLDELFEITGNGVDTYHGFTKILWIQRNEHDNWRRIDKLLTPHGYVIQRLTGEIAIDQSSAGNIGGVFDLKARAWSESCCEQLGIPMTLLPERIVESSEVVGSLTADAARLTGLAPGTPVVSGGIDAAVATLSAGAFDEGDHVAMIGTSMCWGVVHEGQGVSPRLVSMPYVAYPSEKVYTFGGAATAGALVRWFRDEFGQPETALAARDRGDAYKMLDDEAAKIPPGSDRLVVLPYFMGERSPIWDSNARGTILGLTLSHTRAHIYRALLEGVAFALRHNMEAGEEIGLRLDKTCALVGGAAKSRLWSQILSDVTGYRLAAAQGSEAALGDALLAGIGIGAVDRFEAIRDWLTFEEPTTPNEAAKESYDHLYSIYKDAYPRLRELMGALSLHDATG